MSQVGRTLYYGGLEQMAHQQRENLWLWVEYALLPLRHAEIWFPLRGGRTVRK